MFKPYLCPIHRIKTEYLHFSHISIVSFHCGGLQRQNDQNCVAVQIFIDLTLCAFRLSYHSIIFISSFRFLWSLTGSIRPIHQSNWSLFPEGRNKVFNMINSMTWSSCPENHSSSASNFSSTFDGSYVFYSPFCKLSIFECIFNAYKNKGTNHLIISQWQSFITKSYNKLIQTLNLVSFCVVIFYSVNIMYFVISYI